MQIYPASTGRKFVELLRTIDSLQLTDNFKVATPVNWKHGEDVIITPAVNDDEAKLRSNVECKDSEQWHAAAGYRTDQLLMLNSKGSHMIKRACFAAIVFAIFCTAAPSGASLRLDSLVVNPNAPKPSQFTAWGPVTNGLQAAITGTGFISLSGSQYFAALRNVSGSPIYMCGLPWSTIFLTSSTGSTITPTASDVRSVFSPFTETIEMLPNEEWVIPDGMTLGSSYKTKPSDAVAAVYELEVHIGGQELSSCFHATTLNVKTTPFAINFGS